MNEELFKVLKMIEEGKITAEQGAELLAALEKDDVKREEDADAEEAAETCREKKKARFITIRVSDGKEKAVNVKVPVGLASCFQKFIPKAVVAKLKHGKDEIDLADMLKNLDGCCCGDIFDLDAEDGTKVKICCE